MKEYLKGFHYWFGATWGIISALSLFLAISSVFIYIKGFLKGLLG